MTTCEICGTEFDELGVQIVVPELARSFDRIECAARARALAGLRARSVAPAPAALVDVAPRGQSRLYGLPGLTAGLAAALAGGRARVALGSASVAVALLVATTVHLSSRIGGGSDREARASLPSAPPRDAGDFLFGNSAPEARSPKPTFTRAPQQADGIYLVAHRLLDRARATNRAASEDQPRSQKRKPARYSRNTSRLASARAGGNVSTRPGWGWGDKNHAHSGPAESAGAGRLGKAHGRT